MSREWSDGKVVSAYEQAMRNQVIEECAKLVENEYYDEIGGSVLAAMIRALRDKT